MNDEQARKQRIYDTLEPILQTSPNAHKELVDAGWQGIQLAEPRPFPLRRLLLAGAGLAGVVGLAVAWVVR